MKSKLLHDENGRRTFVIVFDKNDEVRTSLLEFANTNRFADAHFTAVGAFSEVTLGFFVRQKKTYHKIPIKEQVEVLSFAGNHCPTGRQAKVAWTCRYRQSRRHGARRPLS
jgi:uncharacterized protein